MLNVTVSNSCQVLSVTAISYIKGGGVSDKSALNARSKSLSELVITHYSSGESVTVPIYFSGGTGTVGIDISTLPSPNGLYKVCLVENGVEQVCKPVLIHCDLDCCLTKLTNEILDCSCDCARCSASLAKAQKIFLLLSASEAAESNASLDGQSTNEGYYVDILNKYNKAVELCDASCGCDC